MKTDNCQNQNIDHGGLKISIIKIEQIIVHNLRKIRFYLLVRSIKNLLGLKYYYIGQKSKISLEERFTSKKQATPVSDINVGDYIKIRSKDEILKTLDKNNRLEGCFFMQDMFDHCGTRHKVLKKIENFYDEATSKMRKARNTFLLEDLHCSGTLTGYWTNCDRHCYTFWKEAWIEKTE